MKRMTFKQVRQIFWAEIANEEERKSFSVRKKQNDYCTDIRYKFVEFVDFLLRNGDISEKQASKITL